MVPSRSGRGPGRPRDARADAAILDAALAAFLEDGYQGLSVEGVAARAGVGKTTIYRRWPTKDALVAAAVAAMSEQLGLPDTGTLRGDLVALLGQMRDSHMAGRILARLVAELSVNPDLGPIYRDNVVAPRRAAVRTVLGRGVARGELRDDLELDLVLDLVAGPVLLGGLIAQIDPARPQPSPERIVDALLEGLAPR